MKLNSLIWTKENTLSPEFCQYVIDKFENDDRKYKGITVDGIDEDIKKSSDLGISHLDDWKKEDRVFYNSLNKHIHEYFEHCSSLNYLTHNYPSVSDGGYQIQRTKPNEYYDWHHDFCINDNGVRYITYIWYLNDVYKKGYTEFCDGTIIRPRTGKLLFFPSTWTYRHRGVSPVSETKYICTGWIYYHR